MMYLLIWVAVFRVCLCQSLLFATTHDIRLINPARPKKVQVIVSDLKEARGVEYCPDESLVCWSDKTTEEINCAFFNGSQTVNKTTYAKNGVPLVEALAWDWLSKKLYWTDSVAKKIEVMSLKTKHRKVLCWQDLDEPRGIAVDPLSGVMFWTDWGAIPKIERASMDGNLASRRVIISENIFCPNSVTLDIVDKRLFWIDAKLDKMEACDYNGKNRTLLLNKIFLKHPFSLTRLNDLLIWTAWNDSSIYAYNYTSGGYPVKLYHFPELMSIKGIDPAYQQVKQTPCDVNNGGCSHLCLLSSEPPGYSCACPTGIKFINETTCANNLDHMLLLVQWGEISKISLDTPDYSNIKIPLKGVKNAMSIDYDPVDKYFYWTDEDIRRAKLDGTMQDNLVTHEVSNVEGIAIDWIARNIYWTNAGTLRIETLRLNTNYRKSIIVDDIEKPRAIAVSPQHGWLFWADWSEGNPKIERTDLDGSNRLVIVKKGIQWPNGIALDIENNKLYWGDAATDSIEVINMDGKDRREFTTDNVPHFFGIAILGNYLYWTDWQLRSLERINKRTGLDRQTLLEDLHDVMGIKAIDRTANLGTNLCATNNGDCQQFCFYKPTHEVVCSCQIEYELGPDGKSCVIPEAFLIIYNANHLQRVSIHNNFGNDVVPITGIRSISAIDVDINDFKLYWADNKIKSISKAFLNGSQVEKVIEFGVHSPESLAIDWLSSNLYWADASSKRIEVSTLNGDYRRTLFWKNLKEPRNLQLDPRVGYMFWSEWDGKLGGIFRASMDGSSKILFVSDIGRINGLTIDYSQRSLYWTQYKNDVASIEFCDSTGQNRRQIVSNTNFKPMSIAQHESDIFWVDYENGSIMRANKFNGKDTKVLYSQTDVISDLRIVHSSKQSGWNACAGNGNCKNLCLVKPGAVDPSTDRACACPTHYLMKNGSCYPADKFLLYCLKNALYRLVPATEDPPDVQLPVQGMKNVRAIEYDPITKYIYWIDAKGMSIKKSFENGSHVTTIATGLENVKPFHIHDIALDPFNKILFWTCSASDSIFLTRLSNSSLGHIYQATNGEKPRNIVVHAEKALVFWADIGLLPRIVRSDLDGQNRVHIETDGKSVEAVAVDRQQDLLFFSYGQEIFSSDLSGKRKTALGPLYGVKIANLAVMDDYLYYWAEYTNLPSCIERINKLTGGDRSTVVDNVKVIDLIAFKSLDDTAFQSHPCSGIHNHANCSHLCIRSSVNPHLANCSCPIGLKLNDDKKTCSSIPPCGKEHFICDQPGGDCIPAGWRCDGTVDCPDGSDEMNCPLFVNEVKCHTGHQSDDLACAGKNHIKNDGYTDDNGNFALVMAIMLIFVFLTILTYFVFRFKKRFNRKPREIEQDEAVLHPLAPNSRQIGTLTSMDMKSVRVPHSVMNGGGSSGSNGRSHVTGASSSISTNRCPLNPPPSPSTTFLREDCCCTHHSWGSGPTLTDSMYKTDDGFCPPPPSQTNSSDTPSPSSSLYFRPSTCHYHPPPPPPTRSPTPDNDVV